MLHMWCRELIRAERLHFSKETVLQNLLELLLVCGLVLVFLLYIITKPNTIPTYYWLAWRCMLSIMVQCSILQVPDCCQISKICFQLLSELMRSDKDCQGLKSNNISLVYCSEPVGSSCHGNEGPINMGIC